MPLNCSDIHSRLTALKQLKGEFDSAYALALSSKKPKSISEAKGLKRQLEQAMDTLYQELIPFKITHTLSLLLEQEGVDKNSIAYGLAGVSTPEAMTMRTQLMEKGVDKDFIAWGLAGVHTPEAYAFRDLYLKDNPTLYAQSFSTGYVYLDVIVCRYGYAE